MLRRAYVDNFRCLVNFEFRPGKLSLILGSNGSGKSTLLDVLVLLRGMIVDGAPLQPHTWMEDRTRFRDRAEQTFETDVEIGGNLLQYRLQLMHWGSPLKLRVYSEHLHCSGKTLFLFHQGEVHLHDDDGVETTAYPFDSARSSALAYAEPGPRNRLLASFKQWFQRLYFVRINPFLRAANSEREDVYPEIDQSNFVNWYRHLVQEDTRSFQALQDGLREGIAGLESLRTQKTPDGGRQLVADFASSGESTRYWVAFDRLSDGQRALIILYTYLHFIIKRGGVVFFDEPESFIALREIEPWLREVTLQAEEGEGQVCIVSHHPEILNQIAPEHGVVFFRDNNGPVRVRKFSPDDNGHLSPAELVARGWLDG